MNALVLFPIETVPHTYRWFEVADTAVVARGDMAADEAAARVADVDRVTVVMPADAVTLHWADLPDRSRAQAVAAARLAVADASIVPVADLHVAVGREDGAHERPVGVVADRDMVAAIERLARDGIDPDAVVPATMLLPRPIEGFVRADLPNGAVVRGPTSGFADEPVLRDLVLGEAVPVTLTDDETDVAIAAGAIAPVLNLRQGAFAKRRRRAIDWALLRRCAWLGVAILSVTLLISLAQIVRYSVATTALQRQADQVAQTGLPRGESVSDADRQLDARLTGLRGGGLGFERTAASVFNAVQSVPGAELTALSYGENGAMQIGVSGQGEAAVNDLKHRLEAMGFAVQAGTFTASGGQVTGQMTVTP